MNDNDIDEALAADLAAILRHYLASDVVETLRHGPLSEIPVALSSIFDEIMMILTDLSLSLVKVFAEDKEAVYYITQIIRCTKLTDDERRDLRGLIDSLAVEFMTVRKSW